MKATPQAEEAIFKIVTDRFPIVTVIRIRDAIETASDVLGNIGLATRLIGLLSILAGILVLAGAMLATQRRRIHEAVVMKVLGATRARIAASLPGNSRHWGWRRRWRPWLWVLWPLIWW